MDLVAAFGFILALLAVGRVLAAARVLPERAPETLNLVVLHVCLPASVLLYAPRLHFEPRLAAAVVVPWLLAAASAALVVAARRVLRFDAPTTAVLLLAIPLGNTAFLGYPLIGALAGEAALPPAVLYDQFGTFVMLSTVGLATLAAFAQGRAPDAGQIARRILTFPPFLALVLALAVMPARYPAPIEAALQRLADALLPLVILALGLQLRLTPPREHLAPLALGLAGKLLLLPLLALGLAAVFGLEGPVRAAVVLQSGMPTMITAMALAAMHGFAPALGSALVAWGVLLSLVTLPIWRWVLGAT